MKSTLLLILETALILAGLVLYGLGYLAVPILPLLVIAWASLRLRHLRWRDVGLRTPGNWLRTIILALVVGIGYQALDIVLLAPVLQRLTGEAVNLSQFESIRGNLFLLLASLVVSWTLAALAEEMFFRGYLLNRIMDVAGRQRGGIVTALIVTALIFGAGHAYQGITGVVDTALAGLVLGLLYFHSRQNLWLPILAHGIIDTTGFLLIYLGLYS